MHRGEMNIAIEVILLNLCKVSNIYWLALLPSERFLLGSSLLLLFPMRREKNYYLFYQNLLNILMLINIYRLPSEGIIMMMGIDVDFSFFHVVYYFPSLHTTF
jgi:hypothetical protein